MSFDDSGEEDDLLEEPAHQIRSSSRNDYEDHDWADMVQMPQLSPALVNENIEKRFKKNKIYTNVSNILMSVNPYKEIEGLYETEMLNQHHYQISENQADDLPPHIYGLARRVFKGVTGSGAARKSQSILISGESGAGKTEATKLCLRYIVEMCARLAQIYSRTENAQAPQAVPDENALARALAGESVPTADSYALADNLEDKIMCANPVLEAFGNAKTHRNDNSSRFGKWISLEINEKNLIVGGKITKYLLEESRVCTQSRGERNFNIFYQVCAGAARSPDYEPSTFRYLNQSGCTVIPGVSDRADFTELVESFRCLGVKQTHRTAIFNAVKGILHLGNVDFKVTLSTSSRKGTAREATVVTEETRGHLRKAAALLMFGEEEDTYLQRLAAAKVDTEADGSMHDISKGVSMVTEEEPEEQEEKKGGVEKEGDEAEQEETPLDLGVMQLENSLVHQMFTSPTGSIIFKARPVTEVQGVRDSLAKRIYGSLVTYIVHLTNQALTSKAKQKNLTVLGILDIFGFENFETNSFEQLCINYANEKLQHHFLNILTIQELTLYTAESIAVDDMTFVGNADCLTLLENKPIGVFSCLADELSLPKASDLNLLERMHKQLHEHAHYELPKKGNFPQFIILHYAEAVTYTVTGFLDKNRSKVSDFVLQPFTSHDGFMKDVLELQVEPAPTHRTSHSGRFTRPSIQRQRSNTGLHRTPPTSGGTGEMFKRSLSMLLYSIRNTEPHFIRCVKPNEHKRPDVYQRPLVMRQLVSSGVIAAVTIRQLGYPERMAYSQFCREFHLLCSSTLSETSEDAREHFRNAIDARSKTVLIIEAADLANNRPVADAMPIWQMGSTRVFFKHTVYLTLELLKEQIRARAAVIVQCLARSYLAARILRRRKHAWQGIEAQLNTRHWARLDEAIATGAFAGVPSSKLRLARDMKNQQMQIYRAESLLVGALGCRDTMLDSCISMLYASTEQCQIVCTQYHLQGSDQGLPSLDDDVVVKSVHPLLLLAALSQQFASNLNELVAALDRLSVEALAGDVAANSVRRLVQECVDAHSARLTNLAAIRAGGQAPEQTLQELASRPPLDHLFEAIEVQDTIARLATLQDLRQRLQTAQASRDADKLQVVLQACAEEGMDNDATRTATICFEALQLQDRAVTALEEKGIGKLQSALQTLTSTSQDQRLALEPFFMLRKRQTLPTITALTSVQEELGPQDDQDVGDNSAGDKEEGEGDIETEGEGDIETEGGDNEPEEGDKTIPLVPGVSVLPEGGSETEERGGDNETEERERDTKTGIGDEAEEILEAESEATGEIVAHGTEAEANEVEEEATNANPQTGMEDSAEAKGEADGEADSFARLIQDMQDMVVYLEQLHQRQKEIQAAAEIGDQHKLEEKFGAPKVDMESRGSLLAQLKHKQIVVDKVAAAIKGVHDLTEWLTLCEDAFAMAQRAHVDTNELQLQMAKVRCSKLLKDCMTLDIEPLKRTLDQIQTLKDEGAAWSPKLTSSWCNAKTRLATLEQKMFQPVKPVLAPLIVRAEDDDDDDDDDDFEAEQAAVAALAASKVEVATDLAAISLKLDTPVSATQYKPVPAQSTAKRASHFTYIDVEKAKAGARKSMRAGHALTPEELARRAEVLQDALLELRPKAQKTKIFGGLLDDAVACSPYSIPVVVFDTITYLRKHALKHVGLFRIPGSNDSIKALKDAYENQSNISLESEWSIDDIGSVLKLFLRELSEPLIPYTHYNHMLEATALMDANETLALEKFRVLIGSMGLKSRSLLHFLISFLADVSEHCKVNKMTPKNLAIVFAPNLLQFPGSDLSRTVADMNKCIACIALLIVHSKTFFLTPLVPDHDLYVERSNSQQSDLAVPGRGRLHLVVHGASNLAGGKSMSLPDPYVSIRCCGKKKKTKVVKHSLQPEWEQRFSFDVENPLSAILKLSVKTKSKGKPTTLGHAIFTVVQIARFCVQSKGNKSEGKKIHKIWPLQAAPHGEIDCTLYFEELEKGTRKKYRIRRR